MPSSIFLIVASITLIFSVFISDTIEKSIQGILISIVGLLFAMYFKKSE